MTMELCLLLILCCYGVIAKTEPEVKSTLDFAKIAKDCMVKTNVPVEKIEMLKKGNRSAESAELKGHLLCVLMSTGEMSANGVFKMDAALAKYPDQDRKEAETVIDSCLNATTRDLGSPSNTAWKYVLCNLSKDAKYRVIF